MTVLQGEIMRKDMWEVVAYMPNHGQHYCNLFPTKGDALIYQAIQQSNPLFERVIIHKVSVKWILQ